jgi:molybdate transport system permease protein
MNYVDILAPLLLSFKLAGLATALLFVIGVPLAWALSGGRTPLKSALTALLTLPLVLPPTVLGFYLLLAFAPGSALAAAVDRLFGVSLVFSFEGLVAASVVYSLPFMINPLLAGFDSLPASLREASITLGKSGAETLLRVLLPSMKPSIVTALVLTFAHTVGEFGVVLMIGGSIPGETRVASIAIFNEVEKLNYETAHLYAAVLVALMFAILLVVGMVSRKRTGLV